MVVRRLAIALALVVLAALAVAAWVLWRDPYALVRAEFARQRIAAGLARDSRTIAGERWVYALDERAPADAPTIVMLHGFTGSKENWYPLAQRLRGRYRLLIPDLPGWGESQRRADVDYGFAAQAARVSTFLRALAPGRRVVLLGHSMGGGIATLVAARDPGAVAALGLFDAAGARFDNVFARQVDAGSNPFAVDDARSLQRYIDTVFHREDAKPWIPWLARRGLVAQRRAEAGFEQSVLARIGRGPERFLPEAEAARIRQPVLLLWCRQDAVIDPGALSRYAARIPQARRVLLDDCGHMSLVEQPDAVAQALTAWIQESLPR